MKCVCVCVWEGVCAKNNTKVNIYDNGATSGGCKVSRDLGLNTQIVYTCIYICVFYVLVCFVIRNNKEPN